LVRMGLRGEDRIVTTHVGSLPRPPDLLESLVGQEADAEERLRASVVDVVRRQREIGLDVVNDGEFAKVPKTTEPGYGHGTWSIYVQDRLAGYEWRDYEPVSRASRDQARFPGYYGSSLSRDALDPTAKAWTCVGPVSYVGSEQLSHDLTRLRAAADAAGASDVFVSAVSPTLVSHRFPNEHYPSHDEYAAALADAMREEYRAIVDAGFVLQIDDPYVAMWDFGPEPSLGEWRRDLARHIELLNYALDGLPERSLRIHVCWGSWQGPHSTDIELAKFINLLLTVRVGGYSVEASNPRHEHEWRAWGDIDLPDGRIVIPGVVSPKTAVLEHPEVVADRLVCYANAVGRENVVASTDCGLGGRIDDDLAWAKLQVLVEGASIASNRLW
jgi:5-methyltetrahydropteroyltriglutamate--homocysteine methyltransferase